MFNYTRRGLFDKDKLIVSTMLTFSILLKDGKLSTAEYNGLLNGLSHLRHHPSPTILTSG